MLISTCRHRVRNKIVLAQLLDISIVDRKTPDCEAALSHSVALVRLVMDRCCETDAPNYDDHFDDPTLADCCLRDLKEQAYNQQLTHRLKECNVSVSRQRIEAGVIRHEVQDMPQQVSDVDSLATDSDDEGEQASDRLLPVLSMIQCHRLNSLHVC